MTSPTSELSWRLADFHAAGMEPPVRCLTNPELTEGEMMADQEVEEFIKDSLATLRILADKRSGRYLEMVQAYKTDLAYLVKLGRLSQDDFTELTHDSSLHF